MQHECAIVGILSKPDRVKSTTAHQLVHRKVEFDWKNTPLEWIPNHPFASHFINQINMILPAGEFWFCRMYNKALPLIEDPKLRQDVQLFIRQEAMHARAHGSAIVQYLNAHNIDTQYNTQLMDWLFEQLLADAPFGKQLPQFMQKQWLVFRLGLIAAIEHMTCVLGNYVLRNNTWEKLGADPVLLDLIRWHGAEEVEHRCVAFDVYKAVGGGYLSRYYLSLIVTPLIFALWVDGVAHLAKQDPRFKAKKPSVFKPWIWREWNRQSKNNTLPSPFWLAVQQLPFFSPWYNPVYEGSTQEALAYLEKSPAAKRAAMAVAN